MANCNDGIFANIVSDCTTQKGGGLEVTAYIMNRTDIATITHDVTYDNLIEGITMKTGKRAWTLTGVKELLNAGSDLVSAADRADMYKHYFGFQAFETEAAKLLNQEALNDIVVICEAKDKTTTGDGVFFIFGLEQGLYKTTFTRRFKDINAARNIELASMDEHPESYAEYIFLATNYAGTQAALTALLTPAV